MRLILTALLALGSMLSGLNVASAQIGRFDGWWVVAGSFADASGPGAQDRAGMLIRAQARRCGFELFNDLSAKFIGFTPGYQVHVLGAYGSQAEANAVAGRLRACIPASYVKRGRYTGE